MQLIRCDVSKCRRQAIVSITIIDGGTWHGMTADICDKHLDLTPIIGDWERLDRELKLEEEAMSDGNRSL